MTDPRVEALKKWATELDALDRLTLWTVLKARDIPCRDELVSAAFANLLAAADAAAWQSIETMPENTTVAIWSKEHIQNGQEPYPGGGWHRTLAGGIPEMHIGAFVDLGYTHWSLPLRPPSLDDGAAQDEGSAR